MGAREKKKTEMGPPSLVSSLSSEVLCVFRLKTNLPLSVVVHVGTSNVAHHSDKTAFHLAVALQGPKKPNRLLYTSDGGGEGHSGAYAVVWTTKTKHMQII